MPTGLSYSIALDGVTGRVVAIEADISNGIPGWSLTGLPDACVSEARDRCRAAIINSEQDWPDRRVTVAMYPADVRKVGSHYDLAIALSLLVANGVVPGDRLRDAAVFGELALDGQVRAVPGVLPAALTAAEARLFRLYVPAGNVAEAALASSLEVIGVRSLRECVALLRGDAVPDVDYPPLQNDRLLRPPSRAIARAERADLVDVRGQHYARACVEVAAAGGHHLFLLGPPGAGKTMLAERFPALLPDLNLEQSIEVSKIHSVAGRLSREEPLIVRPPYLAPHHSDTVPSIIGGGTRIIQPGAISLAHLGVLFLDEAPEFKPSIHDALRQPLENGEIAIRRAEGAARFPASFQLFLAANPCPCGFATIRGSQCTCQPMKIRRYRERISGPVRDRIDIVHAVSRVTGAEMRQPIGPEGSTRSVADRVRAARERQGARFLELPWQTNATVPGFDFRQRCPLDADASLEIEEQVADGALTQRGADRVVRLAWTLADLAARGHPDKDDVLEALHMRSGGVLGRTARARSLV